MRGPVDDMGVLNWKNKTVWTGDNLPIMRGMNSESVNLIYLDPPFNSKSNYAAPIGSQAAGVEFRDTWTLSDLDNEWLDLIRGQASCAEPYHSGRHDRQRQVISGLHDGGIP